MSSNPKDRIGITKVPLGLLPPAPQAHTSLALLDGAKKYGRWNWRSESVAASVYIDACLRHLSDWVDGEEEAEDSKVHHLGHAAACLFIIMDAQQCGNLVDDRPKVPSGASTLFSTLVAVIKHIYQRHGENIPSTPPVQNDEAPKSWPCSLDYSPPNMASDYADTEHIYLGHVVRYEDDRKRSGTIDGEYFTGTSFVSRVERYRRGYETADDEIAALGCGVRNMDRDPNLFGVSKP